ncbi:MAG: hypothetical protein WD876_00980 [Candidatus Pacearchaeota archaeon]
MEFRQDALYRLDVGMAKTGIGTIPLVTAHLKSDVAKKFYHQELSNEDYKRIQEDGKYIISSIGDFKQIGDITNPFSFFENRKGNLTYLLQYISVPGDACDLGIEGMGIEALKDFFEGKNGFPPTWIEYTQHNLYNVFQAYAIISAWSAWATWAEINSSS